MHLFYETYLLVHLEAIGIYFFNSFPKIPITNNYNPESLKWQYFFCHSSRGRSWNSKLAGHFLLGMLKGVFPRLVL